MGWMMLWTSAWWFGLTVSACAITWRIATRQHDDDEPELTGDPGWGRRAWNEATSEQPALRDLARPRLEPHRPRAANPYPPAVIPLRSTAPQVRVSRETALSLRASSFIEQLRLDNERWLAEWSAR